jgi:hypothetical protein
MLRVEFREAEPKPYVEEHIDRRDQSRKWTLQVRAYQTAINAWNRFETDNGDSGKTRQVSTSSASSQRIGVSTASVEKS